MQKRELTELNKRLAELLGWSKVIDAGGALVGTPPAGTESVRGQAVVPDWCGAWAAAGPLSAEHRIDLTHDCYEVSARWHFRGALHQFVAPEESRDSALRMLLVRAVVDKLETLEELKVFE